MIEYDDSPVPVHPSATVVLVRETSRGPEVLLVQRNTALRHMGGEWVFPGGRVDEADYPADRDPEGAARQAAVRETQEETGLEITADQLLLLSRWTTPEGVKRRFATWFFLAEVDADAEVQVDGGEIAAHRWATPAEVVAEVHDPEHPMRLYPPTWVTVLDLCDYVNCEEARTVIGAREAFHFQPRIVHIDGGACFLYGGDAGYESGDIEAPGPRHRTTMIGNRLDYIRELD